MTAGREDLRYTTKPCKQCGTVTSVLAARTGAAKQAPHPGVPGATFSAIVYRCADGGELLGGLNGNDGPLIPCRRCGALRYSRAVVGKVRADKQCDGRCMAATGHACECSCGGKNHGAAHDASAVAP